MDLRIPQRGIEDEECFRCDLAFLFDALATQLKEPCRKESLLQERQGSIQVEECFRCDLSLFDAIATQPKESCREESLLQERQRDLQQIAHVSSFVLSTILFLGICFGIWSRLSIIQVQPLHKEHGPLSIWLPFLGLLGLMVFICAVAMMILVRAPLTRMQKTMVIFWVILMLL